ncbi:ComF family protein [Reyranella sp. CPCC 100927]|uniref:ComF family protein n=1 Tax=Reyranella sp. CPCC 100927 TaxID=2599616 RepID=UPI001C498316|nr:ComF family protein [Reyranella sp. CPCC 100927]
MDSPDSGGGMARMEFNPARLALAGAARRYGRAALDVLLPPQCMSCSAAVDAPGALCAACWSKIAFIAAPVCACCGLPFEVDAGPETLCGACLAKRPRYRRARAAFRYDAESRRLVLMFKHADRLDPAPTFGRWLALAGAGLLADADVIAPIPLHRWRLLWRRYNQSAELARAVGRHSGKAVVPDLVVRHRRTPSQADLNARERRLNVAGAFSVNPRHRAAVRDKTVLLIDDVLTTGATVEACARTLLRAGAAAVDVLTLARVVRPQVRMP